MTERLTLAAKDTFRSLRGRNFRLFFAGQAVSQTGTWLQFVAQTLLVLRLTGSGVALGLLTAVQFLPILVLGAWAGVVTDRVDKRKLMTVTQTAMMAIAFALGILVLSGHVTVGLVYLGGFLTGLVNAFDNPARRVLVNELVDERDVANAVSLNATLMTGSRMIGPALAGLLIATVGIGWCFLLNGVSFVAVLTALYRMDPTAMRPGVRAPKGEKGQLRAGLRYVWANESLRVPLLMLAVVSTLAYNFQVLTPLLAVRTLGGSDTSYTLLAAVMSVGLGHRVAVAGPAGADHHAVHRRRLRELRRRRDLARAVPEPALRVARRGARGLDEHRRPLGYERGAPAHGLSRDAGTRPRPVRRGVPREHAHRRPDRGLGGGARRGPGRARARRVVRPRQRRRGAPVHAPPDPGRRSVRRPPRPRRPRSRLKSEVLASLTCLPGR